MTINQILESVRACANGQKPKVDISNILRMHRCYALIGRNRHSTERIERALNYVVLKERYRACELFFQNAAFPYAVVKGAVLSSAVYEDPVLRVSGDIDILIHRRDTDEAKCLLQSCGFIQGRVTDKGIAPFTRKEILYQTAMSHQTAPFIKTTSNSLCPYVNVDINMDVLWGECGHGSDMDEVLSHRQQCSLFDVSFYKLTPEMEFIALCLHHYKDMNSIYLLFEGSLRLGLLCDIYFYIRNLKPSADGIAVLSRKLNVGQYVYVCLAHAMEIFEDSVLSPYMKVLTSECDDALLESFGLNEKERKRWDIPLAQRLFHPNLPQYMQRFLTDADIEKIRINRENM